ncbi:chymotrypsin-like elastase family member 2A isoform X1 [Monomorium pharaonis]|uniref:chymotrypsin-like elastase family member 2A isoform X1 n=2 Tax=Monomorium pharaonis TaxID=307658 RepID=UPI001747AEDE|nr:chymotrypsin-like elastase family member 2A isoform X1 [Monomorium pharaonis]
MKCDKSEIIMFADLLVTYQHRRLLEMVKISILIALLLQLGTTVEGAQCPDFYSLINRPGTNEIIGQIQIRSSPNTNQQHTLKVGFNTNPLLHKKPIARIEVAESEQAFFQAAEQGKPLLYHIFFPVGQPIPRLTEIWFNNVQFCNQETLNFQTTKEIEKIVYSPSTESSSTTVASPTQNQSPPSFSTGIGNNPFLNPTRQDSPMHPGPPIQPVRQNPPIVSLQDVTTVVNDVIECGVPSIRYSESPNPLVVGGERTREGEWPWLAALFAATRIENFQFQCGASVLTNKHVITAAHCLKMNNYNNDTLPPTVLLVALGRFNLTHWRERGSMNREVARYVIHPDYAHYLSGDSDLAILILRRPVEYSLAIRPICLWPDHSTDIQHVINKTGYVVGWGEDAGQPYTEDPRMVRVPIVGQETCLRSDKVFWDLTSVRTFCAGWLNLKGPCNGDSGSGFVMYDATARHYMLRGIVSRSTLNDAHLCDLRKYVVYVDVAKYLIWIREQISK